MIERSDLIELAKNIGKLIFALIPILCIFAFVCPCAAAAAHLISYLYRGAARTQSIVSFREDKVEPKYFFYRKLTYKWKNMMDMLWLFSTNNASPNNY